MIPHLGQAEPIQSDHIGYHSHIAEREVGGSQPGLTGKFLFHLGENFVVQDEMASLTKRGLEAELEERTLPCRPRFVRQFRQTFFKFCAVMI